ncbi:MAG: hypothetical protein DI533_06435 [Cereibacter sphaeroides]|uniref:Uncharacterized protein n=1 Tax=Cereibacter sphaeroides TaxID=1063 RepID=A0A2W5SHC1_CERSP|nr:MAG: hypothetical protein DI533_06435 [Cereibacter sphaeroides]
MRTGNIPFRFDMSDLLSRAKQRFGKHVGEVTLNLPFVSFAVSPKSKERKVAQELVIRLADRRVLSAWECCDNCIDDALNSLREIRGILVDKQVELADLRDGPLYLLVEAMTLGIRQFLTFEELLNSGNEAPPHPRFGDFHRPSDVRQAYFDGLEVLRGHISRCLGQVAAIGGIDAPKDGLIVNYQGDWQIAAYQAPALTAEK